jgi:hypothetical protein
MIAIFEQAGVVVRVGPICRTVERLGDTPVAQGAALSGLAANSGGVEDLLGVAALTEGGTTTEADDAAAETADPLSAARIKAQLAGTPSLLPERPDTARWTAYRWLWIRDHTAHRAGNATGMGTDGSGSDAAQSTLTGVDVAVRLVAGNASWNAFEKM